MCGSVCRRLRVMCGSRTQRENMRQAARRGRAVGPRPGLVDVRGKVGASRAVQAAVAAAARAGATPDELADVLAGVLAEGDPLRGLIALFDPPRPRVDAAVPGVPGGPVRRGGPAGADPGVAADRLAAAVRPRLAQHSRKGQPWRSRLALPVVAVGQAAVTSWSCSPADSSADWSVSAGCCVGVGRLVGRCRS